MKQLFLVFVLFVFGLTALNAAHTYSLQAQANLYQSIEYFEDTKELTFEKVITFPTEKFKEYHLEQLKKDSIYWFKIVLNKNIHKSENYFIHFNSMISDIELYQFVNDSVYTIKKGGSLVSLEQRTDKGYLKDKVSFIFHQDKETVLYLRICNQLVRKYKLENIEIISKSDYEINFSNLKFWQANFMGMMIILVILNLIIFAFTHDKLYLHYSLYVLLIAVFFFFYFQFSEYFLFYNKPKLDISLTWNVYIAQYLYLLFFLELLKNSNVGLRRKYVKYYANFILSLCIIIIITGHMAYNLGKIISDIYSLLNSIFVVASFIVFYKRVNRTTKIVLIGSLIMVTGAVIVIVSNFWQISFSNMYYYQLGVFIELILFTIAVNYTYNKEHIEKVEVLYQNSLLELAKNLKEKENQELKNEVDSKNRMLATKAMIISEKEVLILDLIKQLKGYDSNKNDRLFINKLVNNLKLNLSNNSWDEFEIHFSETHPQFYSLLNKNYPNLSSNERKLCAFLKLNLSTKEIASISGKSTNTIDVARSRLRKKMGLSSDANLQHVIANLS
jgi:DNA-binding CsgD family transcriptional regulator